MSDNDQALLPCPFCGGEARTFFHRIQCVMCGALGASSNLAEKTKEMWNRRATLAAPAADEPVGLREEVIALLESLRALLDACYQADGAEELPDQIDGSLLDAASEALELQYPIIWTDEQVATLQSRQADATLHPYTCGGDRTDPAHAFHADEAGEEAGLLYPTVRGWKCPACDYRQFWSHETGKLALATPARTDDAAQAGGDAAAMREAAAKVCGDRADLLAKMDGVSASVHVRAGELYAAARRIRALPTQEAAPIVGESDHWMLAQEVEPAAPVKRDLASGEVEKLARILCKQAGFDPDDGPKIGYGWINYTNNATEILAAITPAGQAAYPTGAGEGLPSDVIALVVAGREAWEVMQEEHPAYKVTVNLNKALEAFASRVCYDDDGGDLAEAHASPCTCGRAPVKEGE